MLPTFINRQFFISIVTMAALLFAPTVFAQDSFDMSNVDLSKVNASSMIENFVTNLPNLTRLVTAVAFIMGMYFIIVGIIKLKHVGEMRTMMSHEHGLKGPIIFIMVGTFLLYLPSAVQVGMSTFWTEPNPYGYIEETKDTMAIVINNVFMIMQLIGIIAFIRGLVLLTHVGGQGGQHGTVGRAMMHIIGGIFCINIYQFVQVIMATFLGVQS